MTHDLDSMFMGGSQDQTPDFNQGSTQDDSAQKGNWISSSGVWLHDNSEDDGLPKNGTSSLQDANATVTSRMDFPAAPDLSRDPVPPNGMMPRVEFPRAQGSGQGGQVAPSEIHGSLIGRSHSQTEPDLYSRWLAGRQGADSPIVLPPGAQDTDTEVPPLSGAGPRVQFPQQRSAGISGNVPQGGFSVSIDGDPQHKAGSDAWYQHAHANPPGESPVAAFPWCPGYFSKDVLEHMQGVAAALKDSPLDPIARRAAINQMGEENAAILEKNRFLLKFHELHDNTARSDFYKNGGYTSHKSYPEGYTKGNPFQRLQAQRDARLYDTGPASIKMKTAVEALGAKTPQEIDAVAKSLLTDEGSARVLAIIADQYQKNLGPIISSQPPHEQVQILTNYMREGPDYIERLKKGRGMTDEQFQQWRANPDTFRMPDGRKPRPVDPGVIIPFNHDKVEEIERKMSAR